MTSFLTSNTMSSVGWYMDSGALRHMTYHRSLFRYFWEQEGGMSAKLGNDATYPVREVGSIPFYMQSSALELSDILFVPRLKKTLLAVSCMTCTMESYI